MILMMMKALPPPTVSVVNVGPLVAGFMLGTHARVHGPNTGVIYGHP